MTLKFTTIYSEQGNEIGHHFCGNCDYLAPYDYD